MPFRYFHFYSFDNDDMKSSKRRAVLLSLIFLLKIYYREIPWVFVGNTCLQESTPHKCHNEKGIIQGKLYSQVH